MIPGAMMNGASPMMGGLPPQQGAPPEMDPLEHLRIALEHAQAALVAEPDDADSQALSKVIQGLYAILAARQKEQEAALGMTPAMKSMSRGA